MPCDELTVTVIETVQEFVDGLNRLSDEDIPASGFEPPGIDEFRLQMLDIDELITVSECDAVSIETAVKDGVAAQTNIAREFLDGLQVTG
ncbi:MAG: hypothetical protein KJP12_01630 [Acidimicrobiia bacterium]|nr:hypothetical protein [Acidimicrobiia bacterium]MBT8213893.1 hypothetical protein [Acidimicrobiia bacterium]NNF69038.1 hypothetical protein [Acidimicrobiia bacterium]NNK90905.1 hypothetical protein [Acidimicrobiia bacterium]